MTKEELLEMVNSTISGNGKQEITGKSLNLALTEIINSMGTGGGGLVVHYLPNDMPTQATFGDKYVRFTIDDLLNDSTISFPYREELQKCIKDNINTYNALMDSIRNKTMVPGPVYFDTTFFQRCFNDKSENYGGSTVGWWASEWSDYVGIASNVRGSTINECLYSDGLLKQAD